MSLPIRPLTLPSFLLVVFFLVCLLGSLDTATANATSPSTEPSAQPSVQPSTEPYSDPSAQPSSIPSSQSSAYPTHTPSTTPSSEFPTSVPTTEDAVRTFNCGKCERTYFDNQEDPVCQFYSKNILLNCAINASTCVYSTYSFAVESLSNIEVSDNCGLSVKAYGKIGIAKDSTITASYFNFTSANVITMSGTLQTTGRGPIDGPGSGEASGQGGSYGGSGGRPGCTAEAPYSNYLNQIGSLDVKRDMPSSYQYPHDSVNPMYPTMGSGGGQYTDINTGNVSSGGRGGGMVILTSNLLQLFNGRIICEGSVSTVPNIGSGSGGSISITASKLEASFQKPVTLSVRGGDGNADVGVAGGGGGRITINALNASDILDISIVDISGGHINGVMNIADECLLAAGGTAYVTSTYGDNFYKMNLLKITNGKSNGVSKAVTVLDEPSIVNQLNKLLIGDNSSVAVDDIAMCYSIDGSSGDCATHIHISASTLLPREILLSPQVAASAISLGSNVIELSANAVIMSPTMLTLDAQYINTDKNSHINFGCWMDASGVLAVNMMGSSSQIMTPADCALAWNETSLNPFPPGFYVSSRNVTRIGQVVSQVVAAKGQQVDIYGPYVGVPSSFNMSSCFSNVSALNMTCAAVYIGKVPSSKFQWKEFNTNQVLVVANTSITVHPDVRIEASLIEMCSVEISIIQNATLDTKGRGCAANSGFGMGVAPVDGLTKSGGGGAGFGGRGGDGSPTTPGGTTYGLSRETFSLGSGGGAALESVDNAHSAGGGFVLLAALSAINHYGVIKAGGRRGIDNAGGGSGGMVYIFTEYLSGNGSISVMGGDGGVISGGGGGGGHIEIDANGESAKYDYSGSIYAYGGHVTYDEDTYPYSYPGHSGYITWPSCPAGSGNNYDTYLICYPCEIGFYSEGGDGECLACSNKPSGSDYINEGEISADCAYECHTGRQGSECYTSFGYFVNYVGGFQVFVIGIGAGLFIILAPLLILRLRKSANDKNKGYSRQQKKHGVVLYPSQERSSTMSNFFSRFPMPHSKENEFNPVADDSSLPTALLMPSESTDDDLSYNATSNVSLRLDQQATFHVLRLSKRLGDKDLRYHVGRMYLDGVNSPFHWMGGAWLLPLCPPDHLKGLFVREFVKAEGDNGQNVQGSIPSWSSYTHFAERVNEATKWDMNGWEVVYYYFLLVFAPPRADRFLLHRRLARASKFIEIVAEKEWCFFRSKSTSLRVGISPDFTLATLDFIHMDTKNIPRSLRVIGQPRLPICLRFGGLGTYFSPWYIDTNDVLMQSISQANEVCIFIDKAWINFIIELNLKLRKLRRYSLSGDLTVFMQNLLEDRLVGSLGGVITQFCCFLKPDISSKSDDSRNSPEKTLDRRMNSDDEPLPPPMVDTPPTSRGAGGHNSNAQVNHATFDADIRNTGMLSEFASIKNPDQCVPDSRKMNNKPESPEVGQGQRVALFSDIGEMQRPVGFGETCRLISYGEVFPGLIFFHESTPVGDVVHDEDDKNASHSDLENFVLPANGDETRKTLTKQNSDVENGGKFGEGGGRDVYGSKLDELNKFYKILADADEKNNLQQEFPRYESNSDSLYLSEQGNCDSIHSLSANSRIRAESHQTIDSSEVMSSHTSSDFISDRAIKDFRKSFSNSPHPGAQSSSCKVSVQYQNSIQVWSWSCLNSKPMLLTKDVFLNCNSVSNLKIIYPTAVEVVGEALSNFFRCETILRKRKYSMWEHVVKFTAMINRILSHGSNKLPRSKVFLKLMTALFALFIFIDIGCTCYLSLTYWCVWGNRTQCNNQTGVILMHAMWPFALIMAPLMGLRVLILNSSGSVARQYLCWSRLACFNCIMMVFIYLRWPENADTFLNIPMLVAYAGSRLFQNYYFDFIVASTENKRTSRGWNGLYTSITNYENREFS